MVSLPETFLNRYPSKSGVKGIMAFFASQAISFLFIPFFFIPVNKSSDTSHLLFFSSHLFFAWKCSLYLRTDSSFSFSSPFKS